MNGFLVIYSNFGRILETPATSKSILLSNINFKMLDKINGK